MVSNFLAKIFFSSSQFQVPSIYKYKRILEIFIFFVNTLSLIFLNNQNSAPQCNRNLLHLLNIPLQQWINQQLVEVIYFLIFGTI